MTVGPRYNSRPMSSLSRLLFGFLSLLSLLLCLAMALMWWPSYHKQFYVTHIAWPQSYQGISLLQGRLKGWVVMQNMRDRPEVWHADTVPIGTVRAGGGWISNFDSIQSPGYSHRSLMVPLWFACPLTALPTALWIFSFARRRRLIRSGHCVVCGYNLTGNVSGKCPECGTVIPITASV